MFKLLAHLVNFLNSFGTLFWHIFQQFFKLLLQPFKNFCTLFLPFADLLTCACKLLNFKYFWTLSLTIAHFFIFHHTWGTYSNTMSRNRIQKLLVFFLSFRENGIESVHILNIGNREKKLGRLQMPLTLDPKPFPIKFPEKKFKWEKANFQSLAKISYFFLFLLKTG